MRYCPPPNIPVGLQGIENPCPRIEHPIWLQRIMNEKLSSKKQTTLTSHFLKINKSKSSSSSSQQSTTLFASTPHKIFGHDSVSSFSKRNRNSDENNIEDLEDIVGIYIYIYICIYVCK